MTQNDYQEALNLFSHLFGLKFFTLKEKDSAGSFNSSQNSDKDDYIPEDYRLSGCIYPCGEGVFRMFFPRIDSPELSFFSAPFSLDENSPLCSLSPQDTSKLFRLITKLFPVKKSYGESLFYNINDFPTDVSYEESNKHFEKLFESLMEKVGLDLFRLKNELSLLYFNLLEYITETGIQKKVVNLLNEETFRLFQADSLGKIKASYDSMLNHFMKLIFRSSKGKHALLLEAAKDYIELHYDARLSQKKVADSIYISSSHFSKIFNEEMKKSFNQYVNELRIEKSKSLLKNPTIRIDTIPQLVGFESRTYFGKIFKRITGTTPSSFRNNALKKGFR